MKVFSFMERMLTLCLLLQVDVGVYNCLNLFLPCSGLAFPGPGCTSEIQELSSHIKQNLSNPVLSFQKTWTICKSVGFYQWVLPILSRAVRVSRWALVVLLQTPRERPWVTKPPSLGCLCNSASFFPLHPAVLADNLKSNPGIKWQYFSSEEGIFTVFPAHKFRCKGSYEHRSR